MPDYRVNSRDCSQWMGTSSFGTSSAFVAEQDEAKRSAEQALAERVRARTGKKTSLLARIVRRITRTKE